MAKKEPRRLRPQDHWRYRMEDARHADFRKYVTAAGQASLQWNALYESMGQLFLTLMGGGFVGQFAAVWSSVTSDRGKRNMLLAALANRQGTASPELTQLHNQQGDLIKYLCGQANELENKRNNIVHAPLMRLWHQGHQHLEPVYPNVVLGNPRAKALEGKSLISEFRYCRDYARVLGQFALEIDYAMTLGRPLPDKPRPPSRSPRKTESKRRQSSRAK